jgi:integrase/recombinase XerD
VGKHRKTLKAANKTTVAIYMRTLKKMLNVAIDRNPSLKAFYPFSQRIRAGSGKKGEALKIDELQKFISIETQPGTPEHEAKLLWLFSFYCQGMNFRDMAYLKYKDIQPNFIEYVRRKTERTEKNEQKMQVPLSIEMIRELLGHSDIRTTESYLKRFDFDRKREANQKNSKNNIH